MGDRNPKPKDLLAGHESSSNSLTSKVGDVGNAGSAGADALHVLYLDFDGVLHHDDVYRHPTLGIHIDPQRAPGRRLFEWADVLVEALTPYPDVSIVLSTSWVRALGFTKAKGCLPTRLVDRVIGATFHSRIHRAEDGFGPGSIRLTRGAEVMRDVSRRRPSQWLALDDSPEGWPPQHIDRVIMCSPTTGLGDKNSLAQLERALCRYMGVAR